MRVYIAGKGIISAIGNDISQTINSFRQLKSGIGKISILPTQHSGNLPAAEVKLNNHELAKIANMDAGLTRTALLSMIAAKEAVNSSGLSDWKKWRTGFISANTVGGMDLTENFMPEYMLESSKGNLHNVINHDSGAATEIVADKLGINDYVTTISTACSSSANSIMHAARLIKNDWLDIAVAGGTDSFLRFTLNGFNSLMILDKEPCKPFDENRKGLNLGEGAAYLVLISEKVADSLQLKPKTFISGYANANDAFHQTASSPEGNGNYIAMKQALEMSELNLVGIDYINLHGTGTLNNDLSEGTAVQRIFGNKVPKASSTKSFTGHTLGASGAIEAIFSILAIEESMIFPNLRFSTPMKELSFTPVTSLMENVPVNNVLSNSFGFGGNCSTLIFSKA